MRLPWQTVQELPVGVSAAVLAELFCDLISLKNCEQIPGMSVSAFCAQCPFGRGGWEHSLQPLLDTDIRSLREGEDATNSEGRRQLSWIWSTQRTSDAEITEGMNEGTCYYHLAYIHKA